MSEKTLALVGGLLVDGGGGAATEDSVVVVQGSTIAAAGPRERVSVPADAQTLDLRGMTVLPGLFDLHVHLCAVPGSAANPWVRHPDSELVLWGARHARLDLEAGFTTVRDAFSFHRRMAVLSLRSACQTGLVPGPRIYAAGYAGMTGSIVDMRIPPEMDRPYGYAADGPWELRKRAREVLRDGFDWIKTFTSGGRSPGNQEDDVWYTNHTPEEMQAIISEVHTFGARVMVHATTPEAIRIAVEAGAETIEHGWPLDDELIEMMLKRGTFLVPTLSVYTERGFLGENVAEPLRVRAQRQFDSRVASFQRAYAAGVKIATGSDIAPSLPTMPHGQNAFELTTMVRYGMSPMDAIVASTSRAAEALGIASDVGTLSAGKRADVLVVRGNPLQDITCLETGVTAVFKAGQCVAGDLNLGVAEREPVLAGG
jgi:imidazolonepropionase-like amidohydrolase